MTENPTDPSQPVGAFDDLDLGLPTEKVSELFQTLQKALRAFQLYDANNPVYKRFVSALQEAFKGVFAEMHRMQVSVEEDKIKLLGEAVYENTARAESIAFLFFKDGVRELVFESGFEDEVEQLLSVLQKAKDIRPEADDLLTLLWEEEFEFFSYQYIDLLAEDVGLPEASGEDQSPGLGQAHQEMAAEAEGDDEEGEEAEDGEAGEADDSPQGISKDDFNPTLYSLDPKERQQLEEELEAEMKRDLRGDVLKALFDRLEDSGATDRQSEIIDILRTLLPNFLSRGAVGSAAEVLDELGGIRAKGLFGEAQAAAIDGLLDELSQESTLDEFLNALRDGSIQADTAVLASYLKHLRGSALASLLRSSEEVEDPAFAEVLRKAIQGIAQVHSGALLELLDQTDPAVAAGAARLVGQLGIRDAGPKLAGLMQHPAAGVRLAAIEAAVSLNAAAAAAGLNNALTDADRSIRIEAARASRHLMHRGAVPTLKAIVQGKEIRQADLSEKIAFFEAYGVLGGSEGFELMDKLLNGKGFLGRKEPPEIRACAAMALGLIGTPQAKSSLEKAKSVDEAVVRNAVNKALRGGDK